MASSRGEMFIPQKWGNSQSKMKDQSKTLGTRLANSWEMNSHFDSVIPFRSVILLCQRSPHIINIILHVLKCTEQDNQLDELQSHERILLD